MSSNQHRQSGSPESPDNRMPYTGRTIIRPRKATPNEPPVLPEVPRVYKNPPPSQRRAPRKGERARRTPHRQPTPAAPVAPAMARAAAAPARVAQGSRTGFVAGVRKVVRRVALVLLVVLVLLGIGSGLFYRQVQTVADAITVQDVRGNPSLASPLVGGMNILLIGVDEREGFPGEGVRSDTLVLVRVDASTGQVNTLSLPRDTLTEIPGYGSSKINVAYGQGYALAEDYYGAGTAPQQGGMALAAQTSEYFLDLPGRGARIDYTAQINFDGFVGIIDALGGITIEVPAYIIDYEYPTPDFGTMVVEFQPGAQRMDGATALIYARTRHYDSDFGRAERQQQVIRAILAEIQQRSTAERLTLLPQLLAGVTAADGSPAPVLTTLPVARPDVLLGLGLLAARLDTEQIYQFRLSPETAPSVVETGSDLIWDNREVQALLDQFFGAVPPPR